MLPCVHICFQAPIPHFDLRGNIVKYVKFSPISQNSGLSSKLNPTCQHESKGMLGFQNSALDIKLLKFHTNRDNIAYLEKWIFNGSSFANAETDIGLMVSKQVREWSRILILSPSWPARKTRQF